MVHICGFRGTEALSHGESPGPPPGGRGVYMYNVLVGAYCCCVTIVIY